MAKRRMITAAIWENPKFARMKYRQQLLVIGLITNADDQGRLRGDPNRIKSLVFPYSNISPKTIQRDLVAIDDNETIICYERHEFPYIQLVNWWIYQKPSWAAPSEYPPPDGWCDRIRYRRGNVVLTHNWLDKEDNCDALGNPLHWENLPEEIESGPSVKPLPSHTDPTSDPTMDSGWDGDGTPYSASESERESASASESESASESFSESPIINKQLQQLIEKYCTEFGNLFPENLNRLADLWQEFPDERLHDYAMDEMRRKSKRPNLIYYEKCLRTKAGEEIEESDPRRYIEGKYSEYIQH